MMAFDGGALGFRNAIINGDCRIAQRGGGSIVNGSVVYAGCDRIYVYAAGFSALSGSIYQSSGSATSSTFCQTANITSTGSGVVSFGQRIEQKNCQHFAGKTVIVSMKVYQDSGAAVTAAIGLGKAGAADNFSSVSTLGESTVGSIPSATWVSISKSFAVSASDVANGIVPYMAFTVGAVTNKGFNIADFQIEVGPAATPFETKPLSLELAQCLRYLQPVGEFAGNFITTTAVRGSIRYFAPMRSAPILTAGTMQAEGVSNLAISSPSIANASYLAATFNGTVTGATAGQAARVVTTTGSSWLSAEL
jgi:hypothetical protein